jgi:hypothetical protein
MDQLQALPANLDAFLSSRAPFLTDLEKRSKVPKSILALVPALFLLSMLVYLFGALCLANLSGFCYPAWKSLVTVAGEGPRDEDRAWLGYWLIFGLLGVVESFGGVVVGFLRLYEE